jgi:archaellum component FlaC
MQNWKRAAAGAVTATCALLIGCGEDGPFSLTVTHVNEHGPQRTAVITISDPQIYTRERLLNDRDDEIAFLEKELKAVDTKNFTPRLKRDIDMLLEIVGALSVSVNPVAGANIEQAAKIADLKNSIEVEKLQNLLDQVKKDKTPADDTGDGTAASAAATGLEAKSLDEVIGDMRKLLTALENRLGAQNGVLNKPVIRDSTVGKATPSEEFRDKMAYRGEIVSALEQAQLDDRHDLNGNALYRLQFKATVFPGQVKNKYGVARLTVMPPLFDDNRAVSKLYLDWLAYVGSQLNPSPSQPNGGSAKAEAAEKTAAAVSALTPDRQAAERYRLLGPATGTYSTVSIPYSASAAKSLSLSDTNNNATLCSKLKGLFSEAGTSCTTASEQVEQAQAAKPGTPPRTGANTDPAQVSDPVSGKLVVPVPPGFGSDSVVQAINSAEAAWLADFLNKVRDRYLERYSEPWQDGQPYLRWSPDDNGRCLALGRATKKPPSGSDQKEEPPYDMKPADIVNIPQQVDDEALKSAVIGGERPDKTLGMAIAIARNVHNLAPTYLLAFERTSNRLSNAPVEVAKLADYAAALSGLAAASDRLLLALHSALQAPIKSQVIGNAASVMDIYRVLADKPTPREIEKALDSAAEDQDLIARKKLVDTIDDQLPCMSLDAIASRIYVPDAFYDTVTGARADHFMTAGRRPYAGATYAYSTAPAELAQRISTVASATQALDLMASVSGVIPSAGTGIAGAGEVRQVASGRVDAIESAPLIVGFSNSGAANKERGQFGGQDSEPSFGWVFGPKVIVDSENSQLDLSQVLVAQPVTADISVPGWWTHLRLRVETAWAANFENGVLAGSAYNGKSELTRQPQNRIADYIMDVPLQTNPATYEQLTEFIANQAWGLQYRQPEILTVEPKVLQACKDVTLLVSGPDLWRGRQVYLDGILASRTEIMPDMRGLAVTFDLSKVQPKRGSVLTIWTQLGQAINDNIEIVAGDACAQKPEAAKSPQLTATAGPIIVPTTKTTFLVKDNAIFGNYRVILRSLRAGNGPTLPVTMTNIDHSEPKRFVVEWPNADGFKSAFNGSPQNGDVFTAELRHADTDDVSVVATAASLYYYTAAPNTLMKASYTVSGTEYEIGIDLPKNFVAAFGDKASVTVSGFQDPKDANKKFDADVLSATFKEDKLVVVANVQPNWAFTTADTVKVSIKMGDVSIGDVSATKAK